MKIDENLRGFLMVILIGLVIPLLLFSVGLMSYALLTGAIEGTLRQVLSSVVIIFILFFVYLLIVGLAKYKRECSLPDAEKMKKWATFSPGFRRYWQYVMHGLFIFSIFLVLFGSIEVFMYRNVSGWVSITVGAFLLFSRRGRSH